jgi:hypothetical protein
MGILIGWCFGFFTFQVLFYLSTAPAKSDRKFYPEYVRELSIRNFICGIKGSDVPLLGRILLSPLLWLLLGVGAIITNCVEGKL